jgi:hypothetical protein
MLTWESEVELASGQLGWPPVLPASSVTRGHQELRVPPLSQNLPPGAAGDDGAAAASSVFWVIPEQPRRTSQRSRFRYSSLARLHA